MNHTTQQVQQLNPYAIALCATGRWIASRHWVPATGGNFSIRTAEHSALVTASGKDKGELSPHDLLPVSWAEGELVCAGQPSAETALHARLYQLDDSIKAVLHTHSVQATVFSRLIPTEQHTFTGYEMQKAIRGQLSHDQPCPLIIFENTQDMPALAAQVATNWSQVKGASALLVRGHGLYVWGQNLDEAKRHLEAWEFLIHCELERIRLTGSL
ncbi:MULTISPECIES: methylthioribulose 1-phosphate dehydratase [Alkalimonas]|uniref:Methylthioribulose-1-phosphate dehydratase n=1 Tax=Alkalimonas mucilaginosa TaxID=3057676 RepID=A0ABU7JIL7_9GAMM|nr:methylthioribulose 1-phosphate dehydratase [Alkalimonas sp. MEB004]MEE2025524.1 methylthioribulose 1-phosphate dehydratase [Alkalimonas sp. MEB004]